MLSLDLLEFLESRTDSMSNCSSLPGDPETVSQMNAPKERGRGWGDDWSGGTSDVLEDDDFWNTSTAARGRDVFADDKVQAFVS